MIPAVSFLGIRVHTLRLRLLLSLVQSAIERGGRLTLLYVNVHCMNVADRDAEYRRILNQADVVYCDGTGVRLGARLVGLDIPERMTGADWIDDLCLDALRHDYSLYLLGSAEGVSAQAADVLRARYPGLRIVGAGAGYDPGQSQIRAIAHARPDVLLVGMGTPRQEKWIATHREELDVPVVWAVGALFEFVSGRIPRGPRWMTDNGLEWLFRLGAEPRKLWRRYLIGNPDFLWRVIQARRRMSGSDGVE